MLYFLAIVIFAFGVFLRLGVYTVLGQVWVYPLLHLYFVLWSLYIGIIFSWVWFWEERLRLEQNENFAWLLTLLGSELGWFYIYLEPLVRFYRRGGKRGLSWPPAGTERIRSQWMVVGTVIVVLMIVFVVWGWGTIRGIAGVATMMLLFSVVLGFIIINILQMGVAGNHVLVFLMLLLAHSGFGFIIFFIGTLFFWRYKSWRIPRECFVSRLVGCLTLTWLVLVALCCL